MRIREPEIIGGLVRVIVETNYLSPATTHHHPAFPSQRGGELFPIVEKAKNEPLRAELPLLGGLIKSKVQKHV